MRRLLCGLLLASSACGGDAESPPRLVLGSTHTTQDSGLLDVLEREFALAHPQHRLSAVVASSGEVLTMAARGDLDVLLTHSPAAEREFVESGRGETREPVMYNDFILAGPGADPAAARGSADAIEAVRRIAEGGGTFVSRGDDSGTHRKELELWLESGVSPPVEHYVQAGAGMADALRLASQRGAYILADRATFAMLQDQLDLALLFEGDERLLNRYSVIVARDARNHTGATVFAQWIRSPEAQLIIGEFGRAETGRSLFTPDAR